jgi:hypothetical protein
MAIDPEETAAPIHGLAARIHQTAVEHGFWNSPRNFGEMIALMTSELSEALEEDRSGSPVVWAQCDSCKEVRTPADWPVGPLGWMCHGLTLKPEGAATELVDAIIRELDTLFNMLEPTPYTVDGIIDLKMGYNNQRAYMHGKEY